MISTKKSTPKISVENLKTEYSVDKLEDYFYRITNHEELIKVGYGILEEVDSGSKNFAFTSAGYKNSQQKSILSLCCFFDRYTECKVAIVSDNLSQGIFTKLVESSKLNTYPVENEEGDFNYKSFHHHFDFIDYTELEKLYEGSLHSKRFDSEALRILSNYDIVLWDMPEMEKIKKKPHFHYRISTFYDSMTIVVSQSNSLGKHVEFIRNFFSNYNVNLNGVLFDTTALREGRERRKFLGIF